MLAPSGALFESLNCLVFVAMKLMVIVQEIVSAIRGRMPRNPGRMSRMMMSMVYFFYNGATSGRYYEHSLSLLRAINLTKWLRRSYVSIMSITKRY